MAEFGAFCGDLPQVEAGKVTCKHGGENQYDFDFGGNRIPVGGDKADYSDSDEANTDGVYDHKQGVCGFSCEQVKSVSLGDTAGLVRID